MSSSVGWMGHGQTCAFAFWWVVGGLSTFYAIYGGEQSSVLPIGCLVGSDGVTDIPLTCDSVCVMGSGR